MLELIQQNPVISFFLMLVSVVAGTWKVLDILFVKPRDFRISVLEKNVDEIRKELQKKEVTVMPDASAVKPSSSESSQADAIESIEGLVQSSTLLNDIDLFYESWKDKALTELQRDHFEKNFIGQKVIWKACFSSVSEERDGLLWASLTSTKENSFGVHVIAVFESKYKEALLMVKKRQHIIVSGVIDSFSLSPVIRKCSIVANT